MGIDIDVAGVITAISLVVTSVATLLVAVKNKGGTAGSTEKALAVTNINETDKKVETLILQVDFLFAEISKLRTEKDSLQSQINRLTLELADERVEHEETRAKLDELLLELDKKNRKIAALERKLEKAKGE